MSLETRVAKLEGAGAGLADGCTCRAAVGGWAECLLGPDEPELEPICPECGRVRSVRCVRIVHEVVSVDDVH